MPSLNTKLASAPNTTSGYVLRATSSTTIGNSTIQDDGTNVAIGTTPGTYKLNVSGTGNFTGALTGTSATFSGDVLIGKTNDVGGPLQVSNGSDMMNFSWDANGAYLSSVNNANTVYKGMQFDALNYSFFTSAGSADMTITSGGNVGIGTSSPSSKLQVEDGYISTYHNINANGAGYGFQFFTNGGGSKNTIGSIDISQVGTARSGDMIFNTSNSGAPSPRMRITSGGKVVINTTAINPDVQFQVYSTGTSNVTYPLSTRNSAATDTMYVRSDGFGFLLASAWAYGSDIRLKENISDVQNGLNTILKLKPKHFDYINGTKENIGWIAQDVQEVIPQAVSINEMDDNKYLALKQEFIVPFLVKAIQELKAELDELKNK
jgi:hypothetical protein